MVKKKRTSRGEISRVHVDRRLREKGYVMPSHHSHPYFELCYIEAGSCRFLVEEMPYDLREGDFLLIPPQVQHYSRYLAGECRRSGVYFRLEDIREPVMDFLPGGGAFFSQVQIFHVPDAYHEPCCAHFARMAEEEKLDDARAPLLLELQLQELLLQAGRVGVFLLDPPAEIHTSDRQVLKAAHFINGHFRQQISSADIAAAAGFSPNYLSRKFREAAGIGVHEYLVFVRLRSAAMELLSTNRSVTEIATRCGFSDSNYFKDAFKKKYGVTPREYRNAARK